MITGIILIMAFLHFFPQYSVRTEWDRVLLATEVMDTLNTIDRLEKTYDFATCSTAFDDFASNLFNPQWSGAMIWWKETEDLLNYSEDTRVPYFTQGYKESMVDVISFFKDDFNEHSDGTDPDGWTEGGVATWEVTNKEYKGRIIADPNNVPRITYFTTSNYSDFILTARMRRVDGDASRWLGLVFRSNNTPNEGGEYYLFVIRSGATPGAWFGARTIVGGWQSPLPGGNWVTINGLDTTQEHILRVKAVGSQFSLYIDNTPFWSGTYSFRSSGRIGLAINMDMDARFDDVVVRSLDSYGTPVTYDAYSFTLGLGYPY